MACGGHLNGTWIKSDACDQYDAVNQMWTTIATITVARANLIGVQLNEDDFWLGRELAQMGCAF